MADIRALKAQIENKQLTDTCYIFQASHESALFLATQYYRAIADILQVDVEVVDDLSFLQQEASSPFHMDPTTLRVYRCDNLTEDPTGITNLVVIAKKVAVKDLEVIALPKLEEWQIKDYIQTQLDGLSQDRVNKLYSICKGDIYRLDEEVSKLRDFPNKNLTFDEFWNDGIFSDLTDLSIFNFSNGVQTKDRDKVYKVYQQLRQADVEPLGLVTILYSNFRKMIQVWCDKYPTEESTGLTRKQIWAINNIPKKYDYNQLIQMFQLVSHLDYQLMNGEITNDELIDYIVVHAFKEAENT